MSTVEPKPAGIRTGIFGGSFDPVHIGHLILAVDLLEAGMVDEMVFVPAARSPFKEAAAGAAGGHRLQMLSLALRKIPRARVWEGELQRGGTSYSVVTAAHFRQTLPDNHLYWILGTDQLAGLPDWHQANKLASLVAFIAMSRPGHRAVLPQGLPRNRFTVWRTRQLDISSTEIRQRLHAGKNAELFLPSAVLRYIRKHHLYGT